MWGGESVYDSYLRALVGVAVVHELPGGQEQVVDHPREVEPALSLRRESVKSRAKKERETKTAMSHENNRKNIFP